MSLKRSTTCLSGLASRATTDGSEGSEHSRGLKRAWTYSDSHTARSKHDLPAFILTEEDAKAEGAYLKSKGRTWASTLGTVKTTSGESFVPDLWRIDDDESETTRTKEVDTGGDQEEEVRIKTGSINK